MTSPLVDDHLPPLAETLAGIVLRHGGPCTVDSAELSRLTHTPVVYIKAIGRRYVSDVNAVLSPRGVLVAYRDGVWCCELLARN
jgi:hypothetical protein